MLDCWEEYYGTAKKRTEFTRTNWKMEYISEECRKGE